MFHKFFLPASILFLSMAAQGQHQFKVLHGFGSGTDGGGLWSNVVFDKQGNLYGTTSGGGTFGAGTVFELTPGSDQQWAETILLSFDGDNGSGPFGGVILDAAGNLYGATQYGGTDHFGLVYELMPGVGGWTDLTLYNIGTNPQDNGIAYGGLARDGKGNLYGTTIDGGAVFELTPGGNRDWSESVLHTFIRPDGYDPYAAVILDPDGNLYGTTQFGGTNNVGIVYQLQPVRASVLGLWKERILHTFGSSPNDGKRPGQGQLTMDRVGNLYGTTDQGGSNICIDVGCGTVFRLTRASASAGGIWMETVLYNFTLGAYGPGGGVTFDGAGNLYGTTIYGGGTGCGVVYELSPVQGGKWQYTLLHSFLGSDGCQPDANLTLGPDGNLYGTTATGGSGGAGVVFEIQIAP